MEGRELTAGTGDEAIRAVRALGSHRYVAGRLHLVHAFAIRAASHAEGAALQEASAWADAVLSDETIDRDSKDERLYRSVTEAELLAVLRAFWTPSPNRGAVHDALGELLDAIGRVDVAAALGARIPFADDAEEEMFPVLVDAGWELLPLARLDPERHAGAMRAYGDDPVLFETAKFVEEHGDPPRDYLFELPAMGEVELLDATDDEGALVEPLVVWWSGDETYCDYVLRGVSRAAKLPPETERDTRDDDDDEAS